jgi:RNA recognition motif-containing protein
MNIYVGNLPLEVSEEELRREFAAYGEVTSVRIMNDRYIGSGQTKAYGFVEMPSHAEGREAIAGLEGRIISNRALHIIEALPLSNTNNVYKKDSRWNKKPRQRV